MPEPTASLQLDQMGERPFSFYPPIVNIDHNEWVYRQGSWSEVLVVNTKTNMELWIPRRFIGEVSQVDEPVMLVGLRKELEYKGGAVWPHERRLLRMPAVRPSSAVRPREGEAVPPPPGERKEGAESSVQRLLFTMLAVMVVGCVALLTYFSLRESGRSINYTAVLQEDLALTAHDDYHAVLRKLGPPESERWKSDTGERQYLALYYPRYAFTILLMGADRDNMTYIGAKDRKWRTIHSVELANQVKTDAILRSLQQF